LTDATPKTAGAHHVGLTVPDVEAAAAFFTEALGHRRTRDLPDYPAVFVSDASLLITLWQAEDPASAVPFDRRRNLGLHHLALRVAGDPALDALHGELSARPDVAIELGPEPLRGSDIRHMMCRIPGGIRLEFINA